MATDLTVREDEDRQTGISVDTVIERLDQIQQLMRRAMEKDVDYGVIPGTGSKPTLLKPGAEKLAVMFRLAPKYDTQKHFHGDGHLTVESTCKILDMQGRFLGEASAMCSTRESKYRYRGGARLCPKCGKPCIKKSKYPPRDNPDAEPGFYCFAKIGGCGWNFAADDETITSQSEERVENPDLADSYNTVLRIAEKRSLLGAIRLVTGSSALFDEEIPGGNEGTLDDTPKPAPKKEQPKPTKPDPRQMAIQMVDVFLDGDGSDSNSPSIGIINTRLIPQIKGIADDIGRAAAWTYLVNRMSAAGYVVSKETKGFVPRDDGAVASIDQIKEVTEQFERLGLDDPQRWTWLKGVKCEGMERLTSAQAVELLTELKKTKTRGEESDAGEGIPF